MPWYFPLQHTAACFSPPASLPEKTLHHHDTIFLLISAVHLIPTSPLLWPFRSSKMYFFSFTLFFLPLLPPPSFNLISLVVPPFNFLHPPSISFSPPTPPWFLPQGFLLLLHVWSVSGPRQLSAGRDAGHTGGIVMFLHSPLITLDPWHQPTEHLYIRYLFWCHRRGINRGRMSVMWLWCAVWFILF